MKHKIIKYLFLMAWVILAFVASLSNMAPIQGTFFNIGTKTIFVNDYSHILFYGILGAIFRYYEITFLRGLFYITLFASSMELLQTFTPTRNVDIDDVLTSIIGWGSGYILLLAYQFMTGKEEKE